MNALTLPETIVEKLALHGDVSGLKPDEKIAYYKALCERVGLDPATQPFKLLKLSGKEVFYCDRGGAAQLNRLHNVSHTIMAREVTNDCYVVTARATSNGRHEDGIGAVPIKGLSGEPLCNAYMKAETKAKRRSTLDLVGLGMLDETEISSIPDAQPLPLDAPKMPQNAQKPPQEPFSGQKALPLPSKSPQATPEQKTRMIAQLLDNPNDRPIVTEFFIKAGCILESEPIESLPLQYVPTNPQDVRKLAAAIMAFGRDGDPAYLPYKPNFGDYATNPKPQNGVNFGATEAASEGAAVAVSEQPMDKVRMDKAAAASASATLRRDEPTEAWRSFPVPFGKDAGKKLEDLNKKTLYGWWANYEVKPDIDGKPKTPGQIAKDAKFRVMLDEAGAHYGFTLED